MTPPTKSTGNVRSEHVLQIAEHVDAQELWHGQGLVTRRSPRSNAPVGQTIFFASDELAGAIQVIMFLVGHRAGLLQACHAAASDAKSAAGFLQLRQPTEMNL